MRGFQLKAELSRTVFYHKKGGWGWGWGDGGGGWSAEVKLTIYLKITLNNQTVKAEIEMI